MNLRRLSPPPRARTYPLFRPRVADLSRHRHLRTLCLPLDVSEIAPERRAPAPDGPVLGRREALRLEDQPFSAGGAYREGEEQSAAPVRAGGAHPVVVWRPVAVERMRFGPLADLVGGPLELSSKIHRARTCLSIPLSPSRAASTPWRPASRCPLRCGHIPRTRTYPRLFGVPVAGSPQFRQALPPDAKIAMV